MSWSESETRRVEAIEDMLNEIQVALNNLASKTQLKSLLSLRQSELDTLAALILELQQEITAIKARLDVLES